MNRLARLTRLARFTRLAAPAAVALSLPFSACSIGNVEGEVDGDLVPAFRTGIVFEANELTDSDDTVAIAAFYTFSNGCELAAEHTDSKADAVRSLADGDDLEDIADDVRSFEEDNLPDDYWAAYVVIAAEDRGDVADSHDIALAGDEGAALVVCHHTGAVDAPNDNIRAAVFPDLLAPFEEDSNRDCFVAEEGDVRVFGYDGDVITLAAEVELKDADGDDAGDIGLGASGRHCDEAEGAMDGLIEEMQDFDERLNANTAPTGAGDNSCQFAFDNECDEPEGLDLCAEGTDTADCT